MNQSLRKEAVPLSLSMMYIDHILQSLCIFSVCYFCCLLFFYCFAHQNTVHFLLLSLKLMFLCCVCTGRLMEIKTEADSTDITEHPRDDKSRPYVCTVCNKRFTMKSYMMEHKKDTLEKTCIHVFNVRNVFHLSLVCVTIRIFTRVNTSAQNVTDGVRVINS